MSDEPQTRATLLLRLRDRGDEEAWSLFVRLYLPLVYRFLQRRGLQDADAADVAQEVLRSVAAAMPDFEHDPQRGTFRGWLLTVTRSRAADWIRQEQRHAVAGDTLVADFADQQAVEQQRTQWEQDYRQELFEIACERVRPNVSESTWRAFWRTAVEGEKAADVAAALQMNAGAVYVARSRVTARIQDEVRKLQEEIA